MKKMFATLMAYIVCAAGASAQTFQTVRGTVCESATGAPIEFATVMVADAELPIGTTTDSIGGFSMKVPVGRHDIQVSYLGYEPVILKEVLVGSSKEVVLNIGMTESPTSLNEVVVTPHINKAEPLNNMAVTGGRMLSTEEASRYAGGMDDPARLVSAFAGVSSNVGNNGIVVRGNAPRSLQWRLEDVEIPNPNHFADVTTFGGGGFTSLSSFVLGNSDFFTGAFPAEYSNALSGVFDMNMRNGNNQKWEHAFKVGVLGIDASSEGPFKKSYNGSYIINYRYSTLSLLSPLLPDDADGTNYQDLSFKFFLPTKKAGIFTVWGTGLIDKSGTKVEKNRDKWEYDQDMENQDVKQYMAAAGIGHRLNLGKSAFLKSTLAFTVSGLDMHTERMNPETDVLLDKDKIRNTYWNFVFASAFQKKYSSRHTNRTGIRLTGLKYDLDVRDALNRDGRLQTLADETGFSALLSAYSTSTFRLSPKWTANIGLNAQVFTLNGNYSIEPRAGIKYQFRPNQSLSLGYGMHSRLEMLNYYFTRKDGEHINKDLDFTRAHHVSLAYDLNIGENHHLKIEPYFQYLYDAPIIPDSTYCFINLQGGDDLFLPDRLANRGKGMNYGIDITFEKYITNGFYYMVTASLFDSRYKTDLGKWYNTRYNRNYAVNLLGGKEWMTGRKKQNMFGLNLRMTLQGGERYSPVDELESASQETAVYNENIPFSKSLSPAFVGFIGAKYCINRKRVSHEFAVQIINFTGYKDYYGHRFNHKTGKVEPEREANMVPEISYKISF
jgi:putative tonB dependent outer membrane protein